MDIIRIKAAGNQIPNSITMAPLTIDNFLLLLWSNQNWVEDYLSQNAIFWFLHPYQPGKQPQYANRRIHREAWHTAPFFPGWRDWDPKVGKTRVLCGAGGKGHVGLLLARNLSSSFAFSSSDQCPEHSALPFSSIRAERADISHLQPPGLFISFTPPSLTQTLRPRV